jgi:hypothetical protein
LYPTSAKNSEDVRLLLVKKELTVERHTIKRVGKIPRHARLENKEFSRT